MKLDVTLTSHKASGGTWQRGMCAPKPNLLKLAFKGLDLLLVTVASARLIATLGGSRR